MFGAIPQRTADSPTGFDDEITTACDAFDDLFESLLALWTPNGVLSKTAFAEHGFRTIEQLQFDPRQVFEQGTWLSVFQLTYEDSEDE